MPVLGRGVPNRPIVIRNDLADPPVLTTNAPVVVTHQPDRLYLNKNTAWVVRSTLQDPPVLTTTSPVVVVVAPLDRKYNGGFSYNTRNTLQDPPVLTTPAPTVITSQPDRRYGQGSAQVSSAPFIAPPASGNPVQPEVDTPLNDPRWFNANTPIVVRNSLQDFATPVTPQPIIITSQPSGLYSYKFSSIIDNVQLGTTVNVVHPVCYSGSVVDENTFAGNVADDLILSGTIVNDLILNGTLVNESVFGGTMLGWCMQEVDITAGEFNDESWDFTISSGGNPYVITGLTIEMYFKTAAGVSDTDPSTVKLSTTGGSIVITDGPNGKGTASLPNANLQSPSLAFYRLDVIQSGKRHTALYGKVGVLLL